MIWARPLQPAFGASLNDAAPEEAHVNAAEALRPAVAGGESNAGLWATIGAAVLMGVVVLVWLNAQRAEAARVGEGLPRPVAAASATAPSGSPPPPPELLMAEAAGQAPLTPPPPPPPPSTAASVAEAQTVPPPPPPPSPISTQPMFPVQVPPPASGPPRLSGIGVQSGDSARSPALVVDLPPAPDSVRGTAAGAAGAARPPTFTGGMNSDEQFAARVGAAAEPDRARATMLRNPSAVVPQGAMIPGVLETALNSDLPGFARAVVSRDVRSFDGSRVLIPRGSRVIGQYRSGVAMGQSRAFVIWTRVLRPDGASVQISSSGADALGRAGLEGEVDRHFFERFGGSFLLSVINAGINALTERPSTQIVIGSGQDAAGIARSVVAPNQIPPTIKVPQGSPIRIFVARDLDFSSVQGPAG